MKIDDWFKRHLGKRVMVEVAGVPAQTWRVYLAGNDIVVLVQPSETKIVDELRVFYTGITRFADPSHVGEPEKVVGAGWDAQMKRWIPITRADLRGETISHEGLPAIPDHLPEDIEE